MNWSKEHFQIYLDDMKFNLEALEKEINSSHISNKYVYEKAENIEMDARIMRLSMED